jgi:hypothetical protein
MKPENDNSPRDDSAAMLDANISRLLKAASDSETPSKRFTESLIGSALLELNQEVKRYPMVGFNWLERTMGWAAMIAAACSAGVAVVASIFLKMNFVLQSVIASAMIFNWLTYLGEFIR